MIDFGVQIHPQHASATEALLAWRAADDEGFSSIWTWDHAGPLKAGPRSASHEAWTLLAAAAARTERARIGVLVTCTGIRPPELIADMARTVDEISGGRLVLGLGAGWRADDFTSYGVEFLRPTDRIKALTSSYHRIHARWEATACPALPILIGGRAAALPLAAGCEVWNTIGSPADFTSLNGDLDRICREAGRAPDAVRRTVLLRPADEANAAEYVAAGAQELILGWPAPFDVSELLVRRRTIADAIGASAIRRAR
ncbi:LLM class flavin-dependent oxidoreductase [Dactylosporangium sp. NPDC051485]|uniref:LLM class flavin-dependent oxidoreductase n=1 Tax=Dactylosporangium sp. NPDC051485 TaxID=3154846 RepID=UPI003429E061